MKSDCLISLGFEWFLIFFMILFKNIFANDDYDIHVSTAESSGTDETKTFNSLETKSRNLISSSQGNYLHGRAIRTIGDSRIATKTKANQKKIFKELNLTEKWKKVDQHTAISRFIGNSKIQVELPENPYVPFLFFFFFWKDELFELKLIKQMCIPSKVELKALYCQDILEQEHEKM